MRRLVFIWLVWAFGAPSAWAQAGPAERPPADFPGAQYIDSTGCVFTRDGRNWRPRLDDDSAPLCGFPPSRSAWRKPDAAQHAPITMGGIERDLTVALVEDGGAGVDLADRPVPFLARPAAGVEAAPITARPGPQPVPEVRAPEPARPPEQQLGEAIDRAIRIEPVLAARMTAPVDPNNRLCELLGMSASGDAGQRFGADPTRGYCAGRAAEALPGLMAAKLPDEKNAVGDPAVQEGPKAAAPIREASRQGAPGAAGQSKGQVAAKTAKPGSVTAGTGRDQASNVAPVGKATEAGPDAAPAAKGPASEAAGEIPANARYVQLGLFNRDGVAAAIAAIRALGYPVAQQVNQTEDGRRIVLAGPFESRERLVAALNRLRMAGYARALAR